MKNLLSVKKEKRGFEIHGVIDYNYFEIELDNNLQLTFFEGKENLKEEFYEICLIELNENHLFN